MKKVINGVKVTNYRKLPLPQCVEAKALKRFLAFLSTPEMHRAAQGRILQISDGELDVRLLPPGEFAVWGSRPDDWGMCIVGAAITVSDDEDDMWAQLAYQVSSIADPRIFRRYGKRFVDGRWQ